MLQQARTIPIIFVQVTDPIGSGFVNSLNRPGGNVTGFMNMEATMAGKWLGLLKEVAPGVARATLLFNPATAPYTDQYMDSFKAAAATLAVEAIRAPVQQVSDLETVAAAQARAGNGGLIVMSDVFLWLQRTEIISLAARYRLPAIYPLHDWALRENERGLWHLFQGCSASAHHCRCRPATARYET
jgi:putative ABC transport system substrate-binding protein